MSTLLRKAKEDSQKNRDKAYNIIKSVEIKKLLMEQKFLFFLIIATLKLFFVFLL